MNSREVQFKKIHKDNSDKIFRLCLAFVGNTFDAKDLQQEILIKIWKNLANFRGESRIETWIYRIATNTAILYSKRSKRRTIQKSDLELSGQVHVQDQKDSSDQGNDIKQLYKAISTLKEIDRILIGLLLEGHSYQEIATISGLGASNVGVRINRIKKILNKKLSK